MIKRDLTAFAMRDGWFAPFYYRHVNEHFDDYFTGNGYYPYDDNYDTNIRVNLKVFLDDNRRINDMSYYKVYDMTQGHGRPVTRDAELTPFDEKKLVSALEACTISTAEEELEQLLTKAERSTLPDGWVIRKTTKKAVVFADKKNNEITVQRTALIKAIDISHFYLDIINCKEFWEANHRYLKKENADPIMALMSLIDTTQYYQYESLAEKAKRRLQISEEKVRVEEILKASETGDIKTVKKELRSIATPPNQQEELLQALFNALQHKDEAMAKSLLQKKLDLNQSVEYEGRRHGIMEFVVKSELDSILQLSLKSGIKPDSFCNIGLVRYAFEIGRRDYAIKLLNAGLHFCVLDDDVINFGVDTIRSLAKYIPQMELTDSAMTVLYHAGETAVIRKFLTKLSGMQDHIMDHIMYWILGTGDIRLMKHYMDQGYVYRSSFSNFHLIGTKCFSHSWMQFYTDDFFVDDRARYRFSLQGLKSCTGNKDYNGLIFLFDEMHAIPRKEEVDKIIDMMRESNSSKRTALIKCMLNNLYLSNDNNVQIRRDCPEEELRKHKVEDSSILSLVQYVLHDDNPELINLAIETQRDLFDEPGAFYAIYNGIKDSKHKELQERIYTMIDPAARTVVDVWSIPGYFRYTYSLDENIQAAKEFLEDRPGG